MSKPHTTVVLIPGMGNTPLLWQAQRESLDSDFNLVLADYRGSSTIEEMADSVLALMPDSPVALAGFSLGGYIALDIVRRYPQRLRQLAFISSSPYADSQAAIEQRHKLIAKSHIDYATLLQDMGKFIIYPKGPNAVEARQCLLEMGLDLGAEEFCRQQNATMQRQDQQELLPMINIPTRVLCGDRDIVTPPAGNQLIADQIPGAKINIIQDSGHLLPLEQPEQVSFFLRKWLSS